MIFNKTKLTQKRSLEPFAVIYTLIALSTCTHNSKLATGMVTTEEKMVGLG